jgi:hypothetical protein
MASRTEREIETELEMHLGAAAQGHLGLLAALRGWRLKMPDELLRAALMPSHQCVDQSSLFINPESVAHRQLIPHLSYSLGGLVDGHSLAQTLRTLRLRNGLINQRLQRECREVLACFSKTGLDVVVFKGADLAFSAYPHPCCRVVGDIDLLVDENDFDRAIEVLKVNGWTNDGEADLPPKEFIKRSLALSHPDFFVSLDVQNHISHHSIWPGADKKYFVSAITRQGANGSAYRTLCPEHAFMQVCGHGVAQNYHPPVRWAADAVWILRTAGESFDWDVMLAAMQTSRSAPILSVSLAYLYLVMEVDVPSQVLLEARQAASSHAFRNAWLYRLVLPRGKLQRASAFLAQFYEAAPEQSMLGLLARFPTYVRNSQRKKTTLSGLGSLGRKAIGWGA